MRSDFQGSSSLHYFHSYATADRIDFSKLSDKSPSAKQLGNHAEAFILLPSLEDEEALRENIKILISRVLYDHLPYFKVASLLGTSSIVTMMKCQRSQIQ